MVNLIESLHVSFVYEVDDQCSCRGAVVCGARHLSAQKN